MTDINVRQGAGWVFYDADCAMCRTATRVMTPFLRRVGFSIAGLQQPWVADRLGLPREQLLDELRVLTREGKVISGADALVHLADCFPCLWPLRAAARLPGVARVLRSSYRWIARNRHCRPGACRPAVVRQSASTLP